MLVAASCSFGLLEWLCVCCLVQVCLRVVIAFVGCLFGCCGVVCVYLLVVVSLVCDSWFECSLDFGLLIVGLMCLLVWYGWL